MNSQNNQTKKSTQAMPRTKSTKTLCPDTDDYDNKRCILLWKRDEYGLTILTMKNAKGCELYEKPIFYIPLKTFMRCGAFWSALNLSTKYWEQRPYHTERTFKETEKIKGAYLIAYAPDILPICKRWAEQCIDALHDRPRDLEAEEVFVEIIVFRDSLKDEIMDAIKGHMLQFVETYKKDIFNIFEK